MIAQLTEAWNVSSKMNMLLLSSLEENDLMFKASGSGRNVGLQFAHIHNVRMLWLNISDPCYLVGLTKIKNDDAITKSLLIKSLNESSKAIEKLLIKSFEKGDVHGFKASIFTFQSYMTAHESHHRGQIILTLKLSGKILDKNISFGIWEWDKL